MLKNTNHIITDSQLKQLKEVEGTELTNFLNLVLLDAISKDAKSLHCEETEFKLTKKSNEIQSELLGSNSNIIKMFVEAFLVNKEFKNIVLNLSRLNFVYSENEIKEIFKLK